MLSLADGTHIVGAPVSYMILETEPLSFVHTTFESICFSRPLQYCIGGGGEGGSRGATLQDSLDLGLVCARPPEINTNLRKT